MSFRTSEFAFPEGKSSNPATRNLRNFLKTLTTHILSAIYQFTGFRFWFRKEWRFESSSSHHVVTAREFVERALPLAPHETAPVATGWPMSPPPAPSSRGGSFATAPPDARLTRMAARSRSPNADGWRCA
jgi:hypothetical protein